MKIIHTADIHLDSKMESNLPAAASKKRRSELLLSFIEMVDYAIKNEVTAIIIAGDLLIPAAFRVLPPILCLKKSKRQVVLTFCIYRATTITEKALYPQKHRAI